MPVAIQHDIADNQYAGFFKIGQGDLHLYRLSKPEKSAEDFITVSGAVLTKPLATPFASGRVFRLESPD